MAHDYTCHSFSPKECCASDDDTTGSYDDLLVVCATAAELSSYVLVASVGLVRACSNLLRKNAAACINNKLLFLCSKRLGKRS